MDETARKSWPVFKTLQGAAASWRVDLVAGLTLAAIAAPAQMATARLGGFPPPEGFLVFIAGSIGFAALGANRFLSAGADSTITPIFAGSLALIAAAGTAHYATLSALLALLVGAIMLGAGFFRAGWVANLLSIPVLTGFLAGIAVHIVLSQTPSLLGLHGGSGSFFTRIADIAEHIGETKPAAFALGLASLAAILGAEFLSPRIPGALFALVGATLAVIALGLESQGVPVVGAFEVSAPRLVAPLVGAEDFAKVLGLAAIIALVVMVQGAATSRSFPGLPGEAPDIDRDFVGLGAGSVLSGLIGGFPVNASPPSTAIVVENGGSSQISSLAAAVAVALVAVFGEGFLRHTPEAALAAILFYVAGRIFRVADMRDIWEKSRPEFLLVVVTLFAVVLLPVQTGVGLAIILSLIHGVWTTTQTDLQAFERLPGETVWWPRHPGKERETLEGVSVVGFQAPLSFLNADRFQRELLAAAEAPGLKLIVLEASSIDAIDYTAAKALGASIKACHDKGVDFAIARLESLRAKSALKTYGLSDALAHPGVADRERLYHSVDEATRALAPDATAIRTPAEGHLSAA
ncbi:SulP family inorganic anion transporter [uncultured Rhodoblastus sp.]|uniref:SulP family inorganic anion transporter n=1 Tax=uncultured Rhodoblastus sp. TaxID=543037 RepID=UPI0025FA7D0C|nr:SulP family inorganic anion transporter [uncultured Rhodoblastus sp.]